MIRQAIAQDYDTMKEFLGTSNPMNTFMISDLDNYGFDKPFQTFWISQLPDGKINSILLKFYNNLILSGNIANFIPEPFETLQSAIDINTIMGPAQALDHMSSWQGWKRTDKQFLSLPCNEVVAMANTSDMTIATTSHIDAIHQFLMSFPHLVDLYHEKNMLQSRIEAQDGIHLFVEDSNGIAGHINSSATNGHFAMLGGLAVRPDLAATDLASRLIKTICSILAEKKISACTMSDTELYLSLGFSFVGNWSVAIRS